MSESEMGMRLRDTGNTALLEGSHDTRPMLISDHEDELLRVEHGYGKGKKPEDYLAEFEKYIHENLNKID